jgi:Raf kinase inhibitor-like YbhB/YbcL family protein
MRAGASKARRRRLVAVLALTAVVTGLAACGNQNEGRKLAKPSADQTTTTTTATDQSSNSGAAVGTGNGVTVTTRAVAMTLASSAFANNATIPKDFTCRGADKSPPLQWTGVPAGTKEIAVVVRDVSIGGFVHWVITRMDPTLGGIAESTPPSGSVQANNAIGRPGYAGPCPPSGTHHYEFRVYALSQPSGVTAGEAGAEAASKVEKAPRLGTALLTGLASAG